MYWQLDLLLVFGGPARRRFNTQTLWHQDKALTYI
jgi:hypothetical protein